MAARKVVLEFTGISPLLMANGEAQQLTGDTGPKPKSTGPKRDPKKEMEALCYREDGGGLYFMPQAFRKSMFKACKGHRVGTLGLETIMKGCVFHMGDRVPLLNPKTGKQIRKYQEHKMRGVNHNMNPPSGVIIFRPLIEEWQCVCEFEVDDEFVDDINLVLRMFNQAGRTKGVGAYRAENGGRFGRFTVRLVSCEKSPVWGKKDAERAA